MENLKIIQKKVLDKFPNSAIITHSQNLFYLDNNMDIFFNIPELKSALDNLNWSMYVQSFAFNIVGRTENTGSARHVDTGEFSYSFNIPILNCENTFVNFYKTDKPSVKKSYESYGRIIDYYSFNHEDCILQDSLEMIVPHVINVKEVHNVINTTSLPRITLLIRLKQEINLDNLFQ